MSSVLCNYDIREVETIQQDLQDALAQKPRNQPLIDELEKKLDAANKQLEECRASAVIVNLASGSWSIIGNGFPATLVIRFVDSRGIVHGWMEDSNGQLPLQQATWNDPNGQINFTRTLPDGEIQTFSGYLFDNPTGSTPNTMAGTFSGDRFEGRPTFGWYAFLPVGLS
ncbi:MAG TPA: hypothetical protein VKX46_07550 [Ktedonobacteraceae bacterium]|jgi:hypothetical protein|nr:hypothetical protein [Ktedonobacteraceae bacterium]